MSFLCSSNPSTSGPLVSKVAHRQVLSFLYPLEVLQNKHARSSRIKYHTNTKQDGGSEPLEDWFISSLAKAGSCPEHTRTSFQSSAFLTSRRPGLQTCNSQTSRSAYPRFKHTVKKINFLQSTAPNASQNVKRSFNPEDIRLVDLGSKKSDKISQPTKEELIDLIDHYDGQFHSNQSLIIDLPNLYQPSDGPHLTVSDKAEDEWPPPHHAWPADMETKRKLQTLDLALLDFYKDPEEIFQLYRELPGPRVPYLTSKARHKLLRHLAIVERKDEHAMLRYLSVVDDMKSTAIPMRVSEWTSALSFVSKYVTRSTDIEVEAALHMWREMEHVAGVKGNGATFNVLFDVACKAGKFSLAEMIYKEMENRGHEFNRYHHVSLIYYYGLRRNGDGARQAYRELVEAGEMVDTVILNAMISSLISAQEPDAAENTYQRMKNKCLEDLGMEPRPKHFKARRLINSALMKLASKAREHPEKRDEYQKRVSIVPDSQTYRILVTYFAVQVGDLTKAAELLHDMRLFELPAQGSLYLALFKGFAVHGGVLHTVWKEGHLDRVLKAFMQAIDEKAEDLYISKWMVVWILKAFTKCSGKSRTVGVWEELQSKWKPTENDMDFVMSTLRPLLEGDNMAQGSYDWILGTEKL